jgi:hypothetical protein
MFKTGMVDVYHTSGGSTKFPSTVFVNDRVYYHVGIFCFPFQGGRFVDGSQIFGRTRCAASIIRPHTRCNNEAAGTSETLADLHNYTVLEENLT